MAIVAFDMVMNIVPIARTVIVTILVYIVLSYLLRLFKKTLLITAKTKKQKSNVEIFYKVMNAILILILIFVTIFSYKGSWASLGLGLGLLSAALGWALQKPITGIAGWIMVVIKRPFELGDRIIVGGVKGDVVDISLTHIYLGEVGGLTGGEENSGRTILIPNAVLFEQTIINYTQQDEFVLDQVVANVTYESDIDEAIKMGVDAAKKHLKELKLKEPPYARTYFQSSGMNVIIRYFAPATRVQEFSSRITKEYFDRISKSRKVALAYPHAEIIMKK